MKLSGKSVLVVCGGFQLYGAEAATLNLMKLLRRAGANVACFVSDWSDGRFVAELVSLEVPYRTAKFGWLYLRRPWWTLATLVMLPGAWVRFRRAIAEFRPDYVFHASYRNIAFFYPLLGRNNVLSVHDKLTSDRQARWIVPRIDAKVAAYFPCSGFIAQDLYALGLRRDKVTLFSNWTSLQPSQGGRSSPFLRVGIVGQIAPEKGHETLLRAVGELFRLGKRVKLLVFGAGSKAFVDELQVIARDERIEDAVEYCGFVSDKESIYRELDLVVVPSLIEEAFGLAALEAQACGLPVIASNRGGLPEVIEESKTGYLFPAGDSKKLAELIGHLVDSPGVASTLGAEGLERASRLFSEAAAFERLARLDLVIEA